jgi:hypothetical protein
MSNDTWRKFFLHPVTLINLAVIGWGAHSMYRIHVDSKNDEAQKIAEAAEIERTRQEAAACKCTKCTYHRNYHCHEDDDAVAKNSEWQASIALRRQYKDALRRCLAGHGSNQRAGCEEEKYLFPSYAALKD